MAYSAPVADVRVIPERLIYMSFLKSIFTWWNGSTVGTSLFTWRSGKFVGDDDQGNKYYAEREGARRWVIYKGDVEASRIPPEWHRWLHYTADKPPTESAPVIKPWEKDHKPNLTGLPGAYYPPGSLNEGGVRSRATGDYEAWTPGS